MAQCAQRILQHPLLKNLGGPDSLRSYLEHEVVSTWEANLQVRALIGDLVNPTKPWASELDATQRRRILQLALQTDSDFLPEALGNEPGSHFEWFLAAMSECGAATDAIEHWLASLRLGSDPLDSVAKSKLPASTWSQLRSGLQLAEEAFPVRAAVWHYGHALMQDHLHRVLGEQLRRHHPQRTLLIRYADRKAIQRVGLRTLLDRLFLGHPELETRAKQLTEECLVARLEWMDALWIEPSSASQ